MAVIVVATIDAAVGVMAAVVVAEVDLTAIVVAHLIQVVLTAVAACARGSPSIQRLAGRAVPVVVAARLGPAVS
jgi:hypothetical protein